MVSRVLHGLWRQSCAGHEGLPCMRLSDVMWADVLCSMLAPRPQRLTVLGALQPGALASVLVILRAYIFLSDCVRSQARSLRGAALPATGLSAAAQVAEALPAAPARSPPGRVCRLQYGVRSGRRELLHVCGGCWHGRRQRTRPGQYVCRPCWTHFVPLRQVVLCLAGR